MIYPIILIIIAISFGAGILITRGFYKKQIRDEYLPMFGKYLSRNMELHHEVQRLQDITEASPHELIKIALNQLKVDRYLLNADEFNHNTILARKQASAIMRQQLEPEL